MERLVSLLGSWMLPLPLLLSGAVTATAAAPSVAAAAFVPAHHGRCNRTSAPTFTSRASSMSNPWRRRKS